MVASRWGWGGWGGGPPLTARLRVARQIGEFLHRALEIALATQEKSGKKLLDFLKALDGDETKPKLVALRAEVEAWAGKFFMPGH